MRELVTFCLKTYDKKCFIYKNIILKLNVKNERKILYMRLFIDEEKECSVIEVQTVEHIKGTNELTIFDFNDNNGKITLSSPYEAESTIRKIGSATGPVKIQGHLSWD